MALENGKGQWKRTVIGSIMKNKDENKTNYLKINLYKQETITLKHGQHLQVLSKKQKLKDIANLRNQSKLEESVLDKMQEQAENMPDFVLAEVVLVEKN